MDFLLFVDCSRMDPIDKRKLSEAFTLSVEGGSSEFAAGYNISCTQQVLTSLHVQDLGEILVPISLVDAKRLKGASSLAPHGCGLNTLVDPLQKEAWQIEGSKILDTLPDSFLPQTVRSLMTSAGHCLGIPRGTLAVAAHLDRMVIYPPGGFCRPHKVLEREPGMFASLILQMPVEGGHQGGQLHVERDGQLKMFDAARGSDAQFHLAIFYGDCLEERRPVTAGWCVTLVFNVCWKNTLAVVEAPLSAPALLRALNHVHESLGSWAIETQPEPVASAAEEVGAAALEDACASSDDSSVVCTSPAPAAVRRLSNASPNMLFFPLEGKYTVTELGFSDLTGPDRRLAHVLLCSNFLDVHLAVVTGQAIAPSTTLDYCDLEHDTGPGCAYKIDRWVSANNTLIRLKDVELDVRTQLVGNTQSLRPRLEELDDTRPMQQSSFHRPVLVIWPKSQTLGVYCRYGFDAVLDRMEAAVSSCSRRRHDLIADLRAVLAFCRAQPFEERPTPLGNCAWRLLRLCVHLRAKEEGLLLLQLLASDFQSYPQGKQVTMATNRHSVFFGEGIRSHEMAVTIAEFECRVSGWAACADLLLRLVSPLRLSGQLVYFVRLCRELHDRSCAEGTVQIADKMSLVLSGLELPLAVSMGTPAIDAFVDLIIALESDPSTSNPQRLSWLASFFPRLDPFQQCRLVVELQSGSRLGSTPSCQQMFRDLCHALPLSDLHASGPVETIIVRLVQCYVCIGDQELLQSLIGKICQTRGHLVDDGIAKNALLEALLASATLWDLISRPDGLYASTLSSLVGARISYISASVGRHAVAPYETKVHQRYETARPVQQPRSEALRAHLASCIHQVMVLERNAHARDDPEHRALLTALFVKLGAEELCHLIVDMRRSESATLKHHPSSLKLFTDLCQLLIVKSRESLPGVDHGLIIDTMKAFIWLNDVALVRALVKSICLAGSGGSWDPADKNALLESILSSTDSWAELMSSSNRLVRDSSTALIGAWIVGLCRILDQTGYDPASGDLRSKIASCVNIFIRTEKSQPRSDQRNVATFFSLLLSKLSLERLCHLIIDLRKLDETEPSAPLRGHYRDLCRLLTTRDVSPLVKTSGCIVIEVMKCLLWLDDAHVLVSFSQKFLEALPHEGTGTHLLLLNMVSSTELQAMARSTAHGRKAFSLFLGYRITQLRSLVQPVLSWDHPFAVFPGHPDVEAFLRSDVKCMSYARFDSFANAAKFAYRLSGTKNGYSVHALPHKIGKFIRCKIVKTLSRNALLKKETDYLLALLEEFEGPVARRPSQMCSKRPNVDAHSSGGSGAPAVAVKDEAPTSPDCVALTKRVKCEVREPEILIDISDY